MPCLASARPVHVKGINLLEKATLKHPDGVGYGMNRYLTQLYDTHAHLEGIADVCAVGVDGQAQPKIRHLCREAAWVMHVAPQQHIACLEVAVHDVVLVQVRHGARDVQRCLCQRHKLHSAGGRPVKEDTHVESAHTALSRGTWDTLRKSRTTLAAQAAEQFTATTPTSHSVPETILLECAAQAAQVTKLLHQPDLPAEGPNITAAAVA
jgi:hypothetical protein